MHAIILKGYGGPDQFEWAEIPVPPVKKGEVRIKIKAVSFNPVDYQIRKGLSESRGLVSNILGRDLSGIVDEVDQSVSNFRKGDEVICYVCNLGSSGTYTEYLSVPAELVGKKPVSLSHEQAASIPVAGITAWLALKKTGADRRKSIFIAGGAGGVGTYVILLAKQAGMQRMLTTSGNEKSLNYLVEKLQLKREQIIHYKDDLFIQKALERNGGHFDVAIDLVGGTMLAACCQLLAIDGNLASVTEVPKAEDFEFLFQKNASFHSIGANAYSLTDKREYWQSYQQILNQLSAFFDEGGMIAPPISVVGPLSVDTVRKAHDMLENGSVQGKLIMTC